MQPHRPPAPLGELGQSAVDFVEREFGGVCLRCLYEGRVSVAFTEVARQSNAFEITSA